MRNMITKLKNYLGFEKVEEIKEKPKFEMPKDEQIRRWKDLCIEQQELLELKDSTIADLLEENHILRVVNKLQGELLKEVGEQ